MMKRGLWIAWCLVLLSAATSAQTGTWKNYTSMKEVRSLVRAGTAYWAATSGGLFQWDAASGEFTSYTNAEGLQSLDLTAVALDGAGRVWAGSSTGMIHVLAPAAGTIGTVPDIANTTQTAKRINRLVIAGDTILVCTDFGLSVFRIGKFEFGDTYTHFGATATTAPFSVRSATLFAGRLWAAITNGQTNAVASASLASPNLLAPEAWTLQPLPVTPEHLAIFNGSLYLATHAGLYQLQGSSWTLAAAGGEDMVDLAVSGSAMLMATRSSRILRMDQGGITQVGPSTPSLPLALTLTADAAPVVGSSSGGILTLSSAWTSHMPNGPGSNQFSSVTVDPDGIVWGASSAAAPGSGMYRFDGSSWRSYSRQNSPLAYDEVYRVSTGCSGSVWGATWGGGAVEFPPGATRLDSMHVFGQNVGMVGISNAPQYIVTSSAACDSRGNIWMAIKDAANKKTLAVRSSSGTWRTLPLILQGAKLSTLFDASVDRTLGIDGADNLWTVIRDPAYKGVTCLYNAGTIDSATSLLLSSSNGLPSNEVRTLVIDRDNNVWVGTDKGIAIIIDPSNPTRAGAIAAYKPLTGLVVNTIAIDPLNQKWVGTTEGVVLLSPDGTQQLASFTVESTGGKLIDNDILSIAVDPKTGTVYFGSTSGLASLTTPAAAPKTDFDKLTLYPNPFHLPAARPLTIDGLVESSSLKVLTVDGRLVRDLSTPGGRIGFWDGKDLQGRTVASGVYLIVAYAEDGRVVSGKVAVITH